MLPCPLRAPSSGPSRLSIVLLGALLGVAAGGCDAWPRASHLPDPGLLVPASSDPRAAVSAIWTDLEAGDDDQPPGLPLGSLTVGRGLVLSGTLSGTGWWDDGAPRTLTDVTCGSAGTRVPTPSGDWTGDVDVHSLVPSDDGVLCVDVWTDDGDLGIDAPIARLDACGVPVDWLGDEGVPLGLNGRGPHAAWRAPVVAGESLAVVLAGFTPNDGTAEVPYALSLALVADGPCPLPPGDLP